MINQEKIIEHFQDLIDEGEQVIASAGWTGDSYDRFPDKVVYQRFRIQALNIIRRACGEQSDHYHALKRISEDKERNHNSYYFADCLGILIAAKKDFKGGWLIDMKALIAAELLGDFIDQAEFLVQEGYVNPAASLAGAVLEDTLRKLCETKNIAFPTKTKIDKLNAELAKAGAYDKLIQKHITVLADIRNNADHGHFDKYTPEDVKDMIKWIRRFSADYLH